MTEKCAICDLEIDGMDIMHGRTSKFQGKTVHTYCRIFKMGIIPECPLADGIAPAPQCNLCCVANQCDIPGKCGCKNKVCQIGVSMRKLISENE